MLGADPLVTMTEQAVRYLAETREAATSTVHPGGSVITRDGDDVRWLNWACCRAVVVPSATFSGLTDARQRFEDERVRPRPDLTRDMWKAATTVAADRLCLPDIDERARRSLSFTARAVRPSSCAGARGSSQQPSGRRVRPFRRGGTWPFPSPGSRGCSRSGSR